MSKLLYWFGNLCFRIYVHRVGRDVGSARVLISTLEWLRWYADAEKLDFRAAVASSRRRGTDDFGGEGEAWGTSC